MMIGARTACWRGDDKSPFHGYVADGLVAYWDGKDNVGNGDSSHNNNSARWVDLVGGKGDFIINSSLSTWESDGLRFDCGTTVISAAEITNFNNADVLTVEVVFIGNGVGTGGDICGSIMTLYDGGICFLSLRTGYNGVGFGASGGNVIGNVIISNDVPHSISARRGVSVTYDNNAEYRATGISQGNGSSHLCIGNLYGFNRGGKGKIMCIRMYSRNLELSEVLENYAVDNNRFNLT